MGTYKEIRRITAPVLRELCIRHGWYTRGDNEEYAHLLQDLAAGKPHLDTGGIVAIAEDIAAHSDLKDGEDVPAIAFEIARACSVTLLPVPGAADGIPDPAPSTARLSRKIQDALLEEACRQWCAFIREDAERSGGEGFARFCRTLGGQLLKDEDFMDGFRPETEPPASGLPELCFSVRGITGELICIKRGEAGYRMPDGFIEDFMHNGRLADFLNEQLGVTHEQRLAMEIGSMHGWDAPGADPKAHEHAPQGDL